MEKTETGFRYVLQAYRLGDPLMYAISILGVIVLIISIWKIAEIIKKAKVDLKWLDLIRMAGSLALAIGFLSQILGIVVDALEAIRIAGDVSPSLVMEGAMISFIPPICGFIVFIISMLFYYILKEVIKARIKE